MTPLVGEGLSVNLSGRPVLQDVDIHVRAGEVLGLLGPNGTGKTTLLRVLASLLRPARGRVFIGGQPAPTLRRRELARTLAYLPQDAECHWAMAVEHVVALGRLPHRAPWAPLDPDHWRQVHAAMAYTDVLPFIGRPVNTLSGGERARVLLARALAGEPRILLADEPVTGLDPAHQLDVMELLRSLAGDGAAVVVVLHDLILASRFCDRIVLLHGGRVAAEGATETVLTPDNLARYYAVRAHTVATPQGRFIIPFERIRSGDGA